MGKGKEFFEFISLISNTCLNVADRVNFSNSITDCYMSKIIHFQNFIIHYIFFGGKLGLKILK